MKSISKHRRQMIRNLHQEGESIAAIADRYKLPTNLIEEIASAGRTIRTGQDEFQTIGGETRSVFDWAVCWIGRWKPAVGSPPPDSVIRKTVVMLRRRARNHGWKTAVLTPPNIPMTDPDGKSAKPPKPTRSLGEIRTILYRDPWPRDGLPCAAFVSRLGQSLGI